MTIASGIINEMRHEAQTTRRFLNEIPESRLAWRPHEKSHTLGTLAMHIATIPANVSAMGSMDDAPLPDMDAAFRRPAGKQEILDAFENSLCEAVRTLEGIDDARMRATFRIVAGGRVLLTLPRLDFYRSILLNHLYHHRGQLGVYLRLVGAKVPSAYGPSGDEMPPGMESTHNELHASHA